MEEPEVKILKKLRRVWPESSGLHEVTFVIDVEWESGKRELLKRTIKKLDLAEWLLNIGPVPTLLEPGEYDERD